MRVFVEQPAICRSPSDQVRRDVGRTPPAVLFDAIGIDADGQVFRRLACFLLTIALLRMAYVATSGVPSRGISTLFLLMGLGALLLSVLVKPRHWPGASLFLRAAALLGMTGTTIPAAAFCVFHSGRRFPLVDSTFERADRMIGFDWLAYARFLDTHAWLWTITETAYVSIHAQFFFAIVILAFSRAAGRLYTYLLAQTLTITLTTMIVYFLPAIGAYEQSGAVHAGLLHHFLTADTMTSSIMWLRGDEMSAPGGVTNGALVSFPSFHAACAVLFTWAAWRVPYVRWCVLVLNVAMVFGTPVHGSHYLVDVIAGAAIAGSCIVLARSAIERLHGGRGHAARHDAGCLKNLLPGVESIA